jgi:hypothetical protein
METGQAANMADPRQIRDINDAAHAISDIYHHRSQ